MSDMTALFHKYEASAGFAQHINAAVLQLKKQHFSTADLPKPDEETLRGARCRLAEVLLSLTERFPTADVRTANAEGIGATGTWPARQEAFFNGEAVLIPEDVVERIEAKHKSQLAYVVEDLREASNALLSNAPLGEKILGTLDEICDVADASASASFRRLRRR